MWDDTSAYMQLRIFSDMHLINILLSTRDTASLVRNIEVLLGLSLRV